MKIRKGFVSNSSSSSYICDVCGEAETVYDGMQEAGLVRCVNGHVHHESEGLSASLEELKKAAITFYKKEIERITRQPEKYSWYQQLRQEDKNKLKEIEALTPNEEEEQDIEDLLNRLGDEEEENPANCPICQYQEYEVAAALKFLMEKFDVDKEKLLALMKEAKVYG
jgi:hypothetical protein